MRSFWVLSWVYSFLSLVFSCLVRRRCTLSVPRCWRGFPLVLRFPFLFFSGSSLGFSAFHSEFVSLLRPIVGGVGRQRVPAEFFSVPFLFSSDC